MSARFRLSTGPARCYRLGVETGTASCLTFLAADRQQRPLARPISPLKTRVRGFCRGASGRSSSRRRATSINATGCRVCGYKTASGRGKWPNRDPIGEMGCINLYSFVRNDPCDLYDPLGLLPPSNPTCTFLKKKMDNITKDIAKRKKELQEDKLKLPETCPGDDKKPSLSRQGHRNIIKDLEDRLAKYQQIYNQDCSDPDPNAPQPKPAPQPQPVIPVVPLPITPIPITPIPVPVIPIPFPEPIPIPL